MKLGLQDFNKQYVARFAIEHSANFKQSQMKPELKISDKTDRIIECTSNK